MHECIAANQMGMEVFALSVITDIDLLERHTTITHEEVLLAASNAAPKLTTIIKELVVML